MFESDYFFIAVAIEITVMPKFTGQIKCIEGKIIVNKESWEKHSIASKKIPSITEY